MSLAVGTKVIDFNTGKVIAPRVVNRNLTAIIESINKQKEQTIKQPLDQTRSQFLHTLTLIKQQKHEEKIPVLAGFAKSIALSAQKEFERLQGSIEGFFKGIQLSFRPKTEDSMFKKLLIGEERYRQPLETLEDAKVILGDALGIRLILRRGDSLQDVAGGIVKMIEKGLVKFINDKEAIESYGTVTGQHYIDVKSLKKILMTTPQNTDEIVIRTMVSGSDNAAVSSSKKASGYPSQHFNFILPSGIKIETQLRGNMVHAFAEIEHVYYDLSQGKLTGMKFKNSNSQKQFDDLVKKATTLTPRQKKTYLEYISSMYDFLCKKELGIIDNTSNIPKLPGSIPKELHWRNIKTIKQLIEQERKAT